MITPCGREVLFSPGDPVRERILSIVNESEESVDLQAFILTLGPLVESIRDLHHKGRVIRVIISANADDKHGRMSRYQLGAIQSLKEAGILVAVGLSEYGGIEHGKYAIVDKKLVLHGSYNFTEAAEGQGNHLIVDIDLPTVRAFQDDFDSNWTRLNLPDGPSARDLWG